MKLSDRIQWHLFNKLYEKAPVYASAVELVSTNDKKTIQRVANLLGLLVSYGIVIRKATNDRFLYRLSSLYWTPNTIADELEQRQASFIIEINLMY